MSPVWLDVQQERLQTAWMCHKRRTAETESAAQSFSWRNQHRSDRINAQLYAPSSSQFFSRVSVSVGIVLDSAVWLLNVLSGTSVVLFLFVWSGCSAIRKESCSFSVGPPFFCASGSCVRWVSQNRKQTKLSLYSTEVCASGEFIDEHPSSTSHTSEMNLIKTTITHGFQRVMSPTEEQLTASDF